MGKKIKEQYIFKQEQPVLKQEFEEPEQNNQQPHDSSKPSTQPHKKRHNRIIIRNLIIDINEKLLNKLCSKYGQIVDINIPRHPVKNCTKGYAFVEFKSKNMCLKAIKQLNETYYKGRSIVVDMAVAKQVYEKQQDGEQIKMQEQQEPIKTEVQVKQQKPKKKVKTQPEDEKKTEIKKQVKIENKQQEDLSNTIFIRNLPMDVTEKDLYKFFIKHGKIKFAKIVMDKETNQPKGTAFVKFKTPEVAPKLINYSKQYEQSLMNKGFSNFVEDPSINLEISGKIIKIFPSQSRTNINNKLEFREIKEKEEKNNKAKPLKKIRNLEDLIQADKNEKRNLKLALQGLWQVQSWMSNDEKQKFEIHQKEKVEKLKNPNNFVSKTRLVFKYLPRTISQQDLFSVCKTFLAQKFPSKQKSINYCKLMLDHARERSIGIAFIQFTKAQISLEFLRWIKQNIRQVFNTKQAILSEFVIQDARKMQVISKKIKKPKVN